MSIFELSPKLYFGKNAIQNLEHELQAQDFKNIFIVIDDCGLHSRALNDLTCLIKNAGCNYFIYQITSVFSNANEVYEASLLLNKKRSKLIIALGQRQATDFAKILAVYSRNMSVHKSVWHYVNDPNIIKHFAWPIVCIPLNLDFGSCANGLSLVVNKEMQLAQGVVSYTSYPKVIIYDKSYLLEQKESELKKTLQVFLMQNILFVLSSSEKDWFWTKNFNYANLISNLKIVITLLKNKKYDEAWNNLFVSNTFSGSTLPLLEVHYNYDFISLILGAQGVLQFDYETIFLKLFWIYLKQKVLIFEEFQTSFKELNNSLFNTNTTDVNLLEQYFCKLFQTTIANWKITDQQVHQIIQNAVIQFQKNYLDVANLNHQTYNQLLEQYTIFFTKVIFQLKNN